jgi:glycosyltransferase involved in cell wall biosynthesis
MRWANSHYEWQGFNWPRQFDTVTVGYAFHSRCRTSREDIVPSIGEALVNFIETHPQYLETDVIYSQWLWSGGAASLILRQQFGWPVVAIARGGEMQQWHAMHPYCRPYVEQVICEADRLLANCEGLRQQAERLVPGSASRISVVYNGCDADKFQPPVNKISLRRALRLKEDCKLLLFCGSIEEVKGIVELADAWSRFSSSHPDWYLVVVGRTVEHSLVKKLKEAGNRRVIFTGQVPHEKVAMYLKAADVYVQPSRLEGLSNATMEAMAVGLPVIATDTNGQRELIRDGINGWLVPPGDANVLYQALMSVAKNLQQAQACGLAARLTIKTKFDPQSHAGTLSMILKGIGRKALNQSTSR